MARTCNPLNTASASHGRRRCQCTLGRLRENETSPRTSNRKYARPAGIVAKVVRYAGRNGTESAAVGCLRRRSQRVRARNKNDTVDGRTTSCVLIVKRAAIVQAVGIHKSLWLRLVNRSTRARPTINMALQTTNPRGPL